MLKGGRPTPTLLFTFPSRGGYVLLVLLLLLLSIYIYISYRLTEKSLFSTDVLLLYFC